MTAIRFNNHDPSHTAGDQTATDSHSRMPNAAPVLVQLEQLSKAYTEAGRSHTVLDGLSGEFRNGEFVCLLGKSGSGKSTLLNLISGIDTPSSGEVFVQAPRVAVPDAALDPVQNGQEKSSQPLSLTALSERERTLFRRRHIGIIFQFFNLIPTLTVLENVTLPLELAGSGRDTTQRAQMLLERVGLGDRLRTYPDRLSGGEQQRVAIARALAHDPLLILADEPTGNLDEETGDTVLELLLELTRDAGKTLIMATHATDVAARADRVLYLVQGKLADHREQTPVDAQPV